MAKFFIEVPHKPDKLTCVRAARIFLETGSHFLTNADWGCLDGDHNARIMLEAESKEDARSVLPPAFRSEAKIVRLNKFTLQEIDEMERHHQG